MLDNTLHYVCVACRLTKSNNLRQLILYSERLRVLEVYNNTKDAYGNILTDITKGRGKDGASKL
jgi:hypothetical protein